MDEDNPQRLTVIVIAAWAGLFLVTGLFDPYLAYVARGAGYVFGAAILLAYYWKHFDSPWPWLAGAVISGALLFYLDYPGAP
ncbi:MAG: hypothetical protein M0D54_15095 [Hyphomonadaceae bacterium JAD_PAG50586_4]|nr:MAG: hypothetical protein M0D54_15095 [Hyphomonadaceae bacterium JAD_PAG50586_4]